MGPSYNRGDTVFYTINIRDNGTIIILTGFWRRGLCRVVANGSDLFFVLFPFLVSSNPGSLRDTLLCFLKLPVVPRDLIHLFIFFTAALRPSNRRRGASLWSVFVLFISFLVVLTDGTSLLNSCDQYGSSIVRFNEVTSPPSRRAVRLDCWWFCGEKA